jgi:hypothetical protein
MLIAQSTFSEHARYDAKYQRIALQLGAGGAALYSGRKKTKKETEERGELSSFARFVMQPTPVEQ